MALKRPVVTKFNPHEPSDYNRESNACHAEYIAKLSKSGIAKEEVEFHNTKDYHGLFDKNGGADLDSIQTELRNHNGFVWRLTVSLHPDDGKELNLYLPEHRAQWESILRGQLEKTAQQMGIAKNNLRWAAAFHPKKQNPHCHIIIWEQHPKRISGRVSKRELTEIRKGMHQAVTQSYIEQQKQLAKTRQIVLDELQKSSLHDAVLLEKLITKSEKLHEWRMKNSVLPPDPVLSQTVDKILQNHIHAIRLSITNKSIRKLSEQSDDTKYKVTSASEYLFAQPDVLLRINELVDAKVDLLRLERSHDWRQARAVSTEEIEAIRTNIITEHKSRMAKSLWQAAIQSSNVSFWELDPTKSESLKQELQKLKLPTTPFPNNREELVLQKSIEALHRLGFHQKQILATLQTLPIQLPYDVSKQVTKHIRTLDMNALDTNKPLILDEAWAIRAAMLLKLSGQSENNIRKLIQSKNKTLSTDDLAAALSKITVKPASNFSEQSWRTLSKTLNINLEPPFTKTSTIFIDEEKKNHVLNLFRNQPKLDTQANRDAKELNKTMLFIGNTCKRLGLGTTVRNEILSHFAKINGCESILKKSLFILNKEEREGKSNFVYDKRIWRDRIHQFEQGDAIENPFIPETTIQTNPDCIQQALQGIIQQTVPADIGHKRLTSLVESLQALAGTGELSKDDLWSLMKESPLHQSIQRTKFAEALDNAFAPGYITSSRLEAALHIQDNIQQLAADYTKLYMALGQRDTEVIVNQLEARIRTSNPDYPKQRIEQAVQQAILFTDRQQQEGNPIYVSKERFKDVCETMGIVAEYPWKNEDMQRRFDLGEATWRGLMRGLSQQTSKTKQQAEMERDAQKAVSRGLRAVLQNRYFEGDELNL